MNEIVIVAQVPAAPVADRWGNYHPCSYQTYRKLKALSKIVTRLRSQAAAARRWHRKMPKNRGRKAWESHTWQVAGVPTTYWSRTGPWAATPNPMPHQESPFLRWYETYYAGQQPKISALGNQILRDYCASRRPFRTPEGVVKLLLTEKEIDDLFEQLVAQ